MVDGELPPKFEHQGRVFALHHRTIGTGSSEIRGTYTEVQPKKATKK
jgi:hypothetical protein